MREGRVRVAGDAALVLELEASIDRRVNALAIGAARAVARRGIPGVRDVVPTFRSVAVYFDPLSGCTGDVRDALERALAEPIEEAEGALVEVPVVYGGPEGPDLEDVAAHAGTTPSAVIERHAAVEYRAYMLGFLPGFAYLAHVDPSIAAPRRPTPRVRVAAGSVGIAGAQTGVYPCVSPGGWQIVGRALRPVFDARRSSPALIAAGDRVRFVPASPEHTVGQGSASALSTRSVETPSTAEGPDRSEAAGRPAITVIKPGLFSTIQDRGRWGRQHMGVPVSGAMDLSSHRLANSLVGNGPDAPTLEATLIGPELRMEGNTVVAIAGADFEASLDGTLLKRHTAARAHAGSLLRFGQRRSGGRAYVAFSGGIAAPLLLGSAATHTRTAMGGFEGRAVRAGDRLPLGVPESQPKEETLREPVTVSGGARLRVLSGPQEDFFPSSALEMLLTTRFVVAPDSDRMGYRLIAPRPIPRIEGREMISDATFTGGIQVPVSGQPIVLMADRPTTGGYPQLAIVITADLPRAGQLVPGDWVEFQLATMSEAVAALSAQRNSTGQSLER